MNKKLKNIVAVFLMAVFPLTAAGISVHHHVCKKHNEQNSSFYVPVECSHDHVNKSEPETHKAVCESCKTEHEQVVCCSESAEDRQQTSCAVEFGEQYAQTGCCQSFSEYFVINESFLSQQKYEDKSCDYFYNLIDSFIAVDNYFEHQNEQDIFIFDKGDSPVFRTISFIHHSAPADKSGDPSDC